MDHPFRLFDATPQSAGQFLCPFPASVGQAELVEQLLFALSQRRTSDPVQGCLVADVLNHRQLLVQARRLKHHTDA